MITYVTQLYFNFLVLSLFDLTLTHHMSTNDANTGAMIPADADADAMIPADAVDGAMIPADAGAGDGAMIPADAVDDFLAAVRQCAGANNIFAIDADANAVGAISHIKDMMSAGSSVGSAIVDADDNLMAHCADMLQRHVDPALLHSVRSAVTAQMRRYAELHPELNFRDVRAAIAESMMAQLTDAVGAVAGAPPAELAIDDDALVGAHNQISEALGNFGEIDDDDVV